MPSTPAASSNAPSRPTRVAANDSGQEQLIDQLRNGIIRMSHAASGIDDDLDTQLGVLRKKMRDTTSAPVVEALVADVSKGILAIDAKTKRTNADNANIGHRLLHVIDLLKPGWQLRRKRKGLANSLRNNKCNFQKFLKDYQETLVAALQARLGSSEVTKKDAATGQGAAPSNAIDNETTEALEHMRNTLLVLVNHLDSDDTRSEPVNTLRKQLAETMVFDSMPDILESVAELAGEISQQEQKRFEEFAHQMATQFDQLQDSVTSSIGDETDAHHQRNEFQLQLADGAQSMRNAIASSTNLRQLQKAVASDVDKMSNTLEHFAEVEAIRHKKFEASIGLLQDKLGEAHSECNELYNEINHLRVKTQLDPLTGLPNRSGFLERAQQEFERAVRYGNKLSLAVADIDHFKQVNDRYGHKAGDTVIVEVGSIIASNLRKSDFVCRYGGEEFVMLLVETPLENAVAVAEKVREAVGNCPFAFRDKRVQVTISVGIAELEPGQSISDLVEKADVSLYAAKSAGRNCTISSSTH